MTTIAWDGKTLAADSRSSSPEQRPSSNTLPHHARICFHCERPAWTGSDNASKLVPFPKVTWRGERIIAFATAGSSRDCNIIRRAMDRPPKGIETLELLWDAHNAMSTPPALRERNEPKFNVSMVMVTEKHLWRLTMEGSALQSWLEPYDAPLAIGSGRDAAMLAMTVMGVDAMNAVWAARAIDPATGGDVIGFDCTQRDAKESKFVTQPAMSREQAVAYVRSGFKERPTEGLGTTAREPSEDTEEDSPTNKTEATETPAVVAKKTTRKPKAPPK